METLLVVESQAITRCCWSDALLKQGYEVLQAWNSSEALDLIRSHSGTVSALILEILLSDVTANKLARRMKDVNPKLCVIALSTLGSRDLSSDLPYDAAVEKPAGAKQMIDIVNALLRSGSQQN